MKGRALPLAVGLLLSSPAEAHIVASRLGDFYAGALHPLMGLQDVILWTALGVLAGMQPPARARWLVLLFPAGLLTGFAFGVKAGVTDGSALVDAGMMVTLGALLALAVRLPGPILCGIAMLLAAVRGFANAGGVGPENSVPLFAAGFAVAGYAAITLTAAAALAFQRPDQGWRTIALRAGGSWVAAIGIMVGGFALASI